MEKNPEDTQEVREKESPPSTEDLANDPLPMLDSLYTDYYDPGQEKVQTENTGTSVKNAGVYSTFSGLAAIVTTILINKVIPLTSNEIPVFTAFFTAFYNMLAVAIKKKL